MVHLNVGGQHFTTSRETLTSSEPGSVLHSMFSGAWAQQTDCEGRVFIDRDGTRFRHILNFLRSGCVHVPRDNETMCAEVLEEADFFGLTELTAALSKILDAVRAKRVADEAKRAQIEAQASSVGLWGAGELATKVEPAAQTLLRTQSEPDVFAITSIMMNGPCLGRAANATSHSIPTSPAGPPMSPSNFGSIDF
jgi:hypothetical protein